MISVAYQADWLENIVGKGENAGKCCSPLIWLALACPPSWLKGVTLGIYYQTFALKKIPCSIYLLLGF